MNPASRTLARQSSTLLRASRRTFTSRTSPITHLPLRRVIPSISTTPSCLRTFTISSPRRATPAENPQTADDLIENITDLYSTAFDEFEIAAEESEKHSIYASDDRQAARDAFDELKNAYEEALKTPFGEEIKRRIGQRIRELEQGIGALKDEE